MEDLVLGTRRGRWKVDEKTGEFVESVAAQISTTPAFKCHASDCDLVHGGHDAEGRPRLYTGFVV